MNSELKQMRTPAPAHDSKASAVSIAQPAGPTRSTGTAAGGVRVRSTRAATVPSAWWLWLFGGGSLLVAALVDGFLYPFSDRYASVPFVVGLLTIGMWHGAFDSADLLAKQRWADSLKGFGKYILVMLCVAAGVWLAPVPTIVAFLLLTAVHFGQEDWDFIRGVAPQGDAPAGGGHPAGGGQASSATGIRIGMPSLPAFSRGLLVIGLPLVIHPEQTADFFRRVQVNVTETQTTFPWQSAAISTVIWVTFAVATLALFNREWFDRNRMRIWFGESAVLAIAAVVLNPEFFVGGYLLVWHAPRHLFDRFAPAARRDRAATSVMRSLQNSLIYLLPAWIAAAGLMWFRGQRVVEWVLSQERFDAVPWIAAASAITVAIYIVVTPPHHLLQMRARR